MECNDDVDKTCYTGDYDSHARVVEASHGRIVVAGGAKMKDVIRTGALGVAYGRNIFQGEDPAKTVIDLKSIIHRGATPGQDMEVLCRYKNVNKIL